MPGRWLVAHSRHRVVGPAVRGVVVVADGGGGRVGVFKIKSRKSRSTMVIARSVFLLGDKWDKGWHVLGCRCTG